MQSVRIGRRKIDGRTPTGYCDRCGVQVHRSQLRKEHTGLNVCVGHANGAHNCYDELHPAHDLQAKEDRSLRNPYSDAPRDDFINKPMTYSELQEMLKGSQS